MPPLAAQEPVVDFTNARLQGAKGFARAFWDDGYDRAIKAGPYRGLVWVAVLVDRFSVASPFVNIDMICQLIRVADVIPADTLPSAEIAECVAFVEQFAILREALSRHQ